MCMGKLYDCNCWAQPGGANDDACDADRVCSGSVTDGIAEVTASPEMECTLGALKDFNDVKFDAFLDYMGTCVAQFVDVYKASTSVTVATPTKVDTVSEKQLNVERKDRQNVVGVHPVGQELLRVLSARGERAEEAD